MKVCHLAAATSLIVLSTAAGAQSSAQLFDYRASNSVCATTNNNPVSSNSACSGNVMGGFGSVSGAGDAVARTAGTTANLTQTGGSNSLAAVSEGRGYVYSSFTLNGMSSLAQQTKLVFHFDVTDAISAVPGSGGGAYDYGFEGLYLNTELGGNWHYTQTFTNGQRTTYNDASVTAVGGGFDYAFTNSLGDGSYSYFYETATENYIHSAEQPGTVINSAMSAYLRGIDLTTTSGAVLFSAAFDANGAASFNVAPEELDPEPTPAPEPATFTLIALGLTAVALGRKRIARH